MVRVLTVLDTGAGPNFIVESLLPLPLRSQIRLGVAPDFADANNNPLSTVGTVTLVVRLGSFVVKLDFIVCRKLATPIILGCDFCDKFIDAIRPRLKRVEMEDGSSVPIVRRPLRRASKKHPLSSLYDGYQLAVANGVAQFVPDKPFSVLVANLGSTPQSLVKNQVIGSVMPHPTAMVATRLTAAYVLGLVHSKKGEEAAVQSPNDLESQPAETEKKPVPTSHDRVDPVKELEELDLGHVLESHRESLREMLREFTTMWDGSLGEINTTEHRIDLWPNTRPVAQHPYRAGPKAREEEQFQVDKMLRAGVIEPA
ncbi:unnamed protein product, partial [Agarophyton chilense]